MAQIANCMPVTTSGKKISVEHTAVIRGNKKAEQKDSRRRISCKDLGNGEYEGWMWCKKEKPGFTPNSWRKYWFMLKDKSLYCYKDPKDVVARRLYHMPAFVVSVARETSRKYAFKISHESFGTVLFATKDFADMSKWMTHLILSCEEKSDTCKRKKADESTGDISESDNEEDNTEDEEKKSLQPVTEKENETEDKDLTLAEPTTTCLSESSPPPVSSSAAASETKSMPPASSYQESTPLGSSGSESHLLTSCNSESDPVRSSVPESTSSASKRGSTPLAASKQEPSQSLCPQPKSNSVHLASPEPRSTQHTSEALEPTVAAKKACRPPATLSKPKPSPKSSPSAETSASPTLERSSLTKPTFGPATFDKPLRTIPSTGSQSSTTDSSATSSAPFALARLAFETSASSSKPLPSVTRVAPGKLPKTSDAAEGSAKTTSEMLSQGNTNTGLATCAKLSSTSIAITAQTETPAVAPVPPLPGRASTGPAFSTTPSPAVSLARASSTTEHSKTQLAASTTNTKNVRPATFSKPSSDIPRVVSETLPPTWTVSGHALSSKPTASAARSSAMSSSNGDNTLPSSEAHFSIAKSQSVRREETRLSAVTTLSGNEKEVLDVPYVHQNFENLSSQSECTSEEVSKDQTAETFESAEPLPELSATKRAHKRMTHIAKSIKLKAKPSPANRCQELCSHLLMLQRSFKDKTQELQILEELLKTSVMTSDKLKQFCHENRDFAQRLTGNSTDLGESFESDTENRLEGASFV